MLIARKCVRDGIEGALSPKPIIQIDSKTNKIINTFISGYAASKELKIPYSGINQVCHYYKYTDKDRPSRYKLKTTRGFIFKFKNVN